MAQSRSELRRWLRWPCAPRWVWSETPTTMPRARACSPRWNAGVSTDIGSRRRPRRGSWCLISSRLLQPALSLVDRVSLPIDYERLQRPIPITSAAVFASVSRLQSLQSPLHRPKKIASSNAVARPARGVCGTFAAGYATTFSSSGAGARYPTRK
jgi:hypothetical protein